ncbi:MAG: thioredoxin family protein [Bacteroidota bacterium]
MKQFSKYLNVSLIVITIAFLLSLFIFKESLLNFTSGIIQSDSQNYLNNQYAEFFKNEFNQIRNKTGLNGTVIKFGTENCVACREMSKVISELDEFYNEIQVVKIDILSDEGNKYIGFYGISAIPVLLILDNTGNEIFRCNGYISFEDIRNELINLQIVMK